MSGPIWVQAVCKSYKQTTLGDNELFDIKPYLLDLAPLDLLFYKLKKKNLSAGAPIRTDYDVIHAVDDFLNGQEEDFLKVA